MVRVIVGRNAERLENCLELGKLSGRRCISTPVDARKPTRLEEAVEKTVASFGRIDFVICGATGNFIVPISGLSGNAFRTVIQNDTLVTVEATLSHVRATHRSYIHVCATFPYHGTTYQAHISTTKAAVDALSQVIAVEGAWSADPFLWHPCRQIGRQARHRERRCLPFQFCSVVCERRGARSKRARSIASDADALPSDHAAPPGNSGN